MPLLSIFALSAAGTHPPLAVVLLLAVLLPVIPLFGATLLQSFKVTSPLRCSILACFITGILAFECLLFPGILLPVQWRLYFLATSLAVIICGLRFLTKKEQRELQFATSDWGVLSIAIISTAIRCRESLLQFQLTPTEIIRVPWIDTLIHSTIVSQIAWSEGWRSFMDYSLAGAPAPLYHYSSYTLPAGLVAIGGLSAYTAASAFLGPVGFFLTILSAACLGSSLSGERGKILCAALIALGPDPLELGIGRGLSSYSFLQQVSPSGGYALAAALLGAAFIVEGSLRSSIFGLTLTALGITFKFNYTFVLAPIVALFAITFTKEVPAKIRLLFGGVFILSYFAIGELSKVLRALPSLFFDGSSKQVVIKRMKDTYSLIPEVGMWPELKNIALWVGTNLGDYAFFPLHAFGIWFMVALIGIVVARWIGKRNVSLLVFPLAVSLLFSFGVSQNLGNGDAYEINLKTVIGPYAFLVCACAIAIAELTRSPWKALAWGANTTVAVIVILGLFATYRFGPKIQSVAFGGAQTNIAYPRGLYDAARFTRATLPPGAVVLRFDNDIDRFVAATSERPAYVLNPGINPAYLPQSTLLTRLKEVEALHLIQDGEQFRARIRELGIAAVIAKRSELLFSNAPTPFESAFESGEYVVILAQNAS